MIKILSARLANQIAAGEVVERPASVVKEIVENCIDAGATHLFIDIEKGGHKRICVRDDGAGIAKDELALALSRHATSKISNIEDLESILSLGFRGEALASISSVSRLTLTSKPPEQAQAWQAQSEGRDMAIQIQPTAHPNGTTVDVADLFFNTPARRKFLRAPKTEFQHIEEIVKRIALSHAHIAFEMKHNGKTVCQYPAVANNPEKRVAAVCSSRFSNQTVHFEGAFEQIKVSGWCCQLGDGWPTNTLQYSFVNGRMMRDKLINHAIRQAYEGMLAPQTFPAFVLFITMPPHELDINVHPAKHEVRFHRSRQVHDVIYRTVANAILPPNAEATEIEERTTHGYVSALEPNRGHLESNNLHLPARSHVSDTVSSSSILASAPMAMKKRSSYKPNLPSVSASLGYQSLMTKPVQKSEVSTTDTPKTKRDDDSEENITIESELEGQNNQLCSQAATIDIQHLFIDDKRMLASWSGRLWLIPHAALIMHIMKRELRTSSIVQPLLMPVSIGESQLLRTASIEALKQIGCIIDIASAKVILKQVPSSMRTLPWVSIFPALLGKTQDKSVNTHISTNDLLFCIAKHWGKVHPFQQDWLSTLFNSLSLEAVTQLASEFGCEVTLPTLLDNDDN